MNYKDITVGIVSFKSENVIFRCLKSIKKIKNIIIFDNSNDINLKNQISKRYPNIQFILSKKNLGYGVGNNKIFKFVKTKYFFILNPDTILMKNCIKNLIKSINLLKSNFSILAPISSPKNYGYFEKKKNYKFNKNLKKVDYVKGFALVVNKRKFKKNILFDKNFFLYLEEIDLCKRLCRIRENIYVCKNAKVHHYAAKSSNIGFEFEKCRNWHWMWSKVYYDKKYLKNYDVLKNMLPKIISGLINCIVLWPFNFKKSILAYYRISGALNSLLGLPSSHRPKI